MTHVGLEQILVFSWITCTLDWWGSWSHPQYLWRQQWMRHAQGVRWLTTILMLTILGSTISDLFSVSVAETRKDLRSPECESFVYPSPTSTMGTILFLFWNNGYNIFPIQIHKFGFFPNFYCFPLKLMKFNLQTGTEKAIENNSGLTSQVLISVTAETPPLSLLG